MTLSKQQLWQRFQKYYSFHPDLGLALDLSRMNFPQGFFESIEGRMQKAFAVMAELEKDAIANPDENRMVSRYWLRNSAVAPDPSIRKRNRL